jgi:hypothetical protein
MRIQGTSWSSTQSAVSGVELLRHVMRRCSCNLLHQQMPATLIAWHNPSSHRLPRQFGHRATRCGSNSRRQHRRPPTLGTASACLGDLLRHHVHAGRHDPSRVAGTSTPRHLPRQLGTTSACDYVDLGHGDAQAKCYFN